MKNIHSIYIVVAIIYLLSVSCGKKQKPIAENVFYTCSMDPQVVEKQPGTCPICKMELAEIIVSKDGMQKGIKLSETQVQLANIKTDTVKIRSLAEEKTIPGKLVINENKTSSISFRIEGRIEKLYIKNPGETIYLNQPIYDLYSEELISVQKDYLLATQKQKLIKSNSENDLINYRQLAESARNKLMLWGLTENQIKNIETEGDVQNVTTFYATVPGTVLEIPIKEGDYIMEGSTAFKLTDLSCLWVEAQLYSNEMKFIRNNNEAEVVIVPYNEQIIKGAISFVNPELQSNSKITLIRIEIDNRELQYKPGMMAYITLKSNEKNTIAVPSKALIRDSKATTAWVLNKGGAYESKFVTTGIENKELAEIKEGLKEGELIVISGAYLLYSEYIFKKDVNMAVYSENE